MVAPKCFFFFFPTCIYMKIPLSSVEMSRKKLNAITTNTT